jgi:hypothetical protein
MESKNDNAETDELNRRIVVLEDEERELTAWLEGHVGGWKADLLRLSFLVWPIALFFSWGFFAAELDSSFSVAALAILFIISGILGCKWISSTLDKTIEAALKK